jgi:hypothetical protein
VSWLGFLSHKDKFRSSEQQTPFQLQVLMTSRETFQLIRPGTLCPAVGKVISKLTLGSEKQPTSITHEVEYNVRGSALFPQLFETYTGIK